MGWIQSKIPEVPITNFTSDWNDGRAVGALVDAVAPGKTLTAVQLNIHTTLENISRHRSLS